MTIRLTCSIMCAAFVPERLEAARRLQAQLQDGGAGELWEWVHIVEDWEKAGPWGCAKRAWAQGADTDATHHLVIQDDAIICRDFVPGLLRVIAGQPAHVLSLFHGKRKKLHGALRWGIVEGPYGLAVVMPTPMIREFLDWQDANVHPSLHHDDGRIGLFLTQTGRDVRVPFPNVVDHRADLKSVMSHPSGRVSPYYIGDGSPLEIDWSDQGVYEVSKRSIGEYTRFLLSRMPA